MTVASRTESYAAIRRDARDGMSGRTGGAARGFRDEDHYRTRILLIGGRPKRA